jgi:hypothetical protein
MHLTAKIDIMMCEVSMFATSSAHTAEEKLAALQHVLTSRTFQKSDLLIRFLRFIGEKEIAGEGDQITEYSIAIEALGRPADFSPEADSSVRSRAHALRRKLEDCYREELQAAEFRVVLPKGSYIPEWLTVSGSVAAPTKELPAAAPVPGKFRPAYGPLAMAFAAGLAVAFAAFWLRSSPVSPGQPAIVRDAWGPILNSRSEVLVVVAVPKQFWARDFSSKELPRNEKWYPEIPQDQPLRQWFFESKAPDQKEFVLLHPNIGSPLWGDVAGAIGAVKTLSMYGIAHQVLPERVVKPYALRGRNVLLFGNPEYSPAVEQLLKDAPFRVEYDPGTRWEAIVNRDPRPGEPEAFRRRQAEECLGLISVFRQDQGESGANQIAVFSGLTSAGSQAAQEYFTSASALNELSSKLGVGGSRVWPRAYQVVVDASTSGNLPIKYRYKAHRIITP